MVLRLAVTPLARTHAKILASYFVGITIIRYSSEAQSLERIRQFANDMKAKRKVADEADEEYSLGSGNNSVAVRKGRFIVDVEVNAEAKDEKELLKRFTSLALRAVKE